MTGSLKAAPGAVRPRTAPPPSFSVPFQSMIVQCTIPEGPCIKQDPFPGDRPPRRHRGSILQRRGPPAWLSAEPGAFTTIEVPGASYTEARGINPKAVSWGSTLSPEAFAMAFC